MKLFGCQLSLVLLLCGFAAEAAQERGGKIEFSDGNVVSGLISMTPGSELKIQAGPKVRVLTFDRVQEIRFTPEKEEMERAWRFKEAGQTAKEFSGEPYPVRHLATTVTLANGEKIAGHLYTTVLYVVVGEKAQKVILIAKQRGKESETLKQLVYPKQITFGDSAVAAEANVKLKLSGLGEQPKVMVLTHGALARLETKPLGSPGEFEMPSPLGKEIFIAAKSGQHIVVGWPKLANEEAAALVRNAFTNSQDFFDERQILGVYEDTANSEVYSLILGVRRGKTTLHKDASQPWRLEIYRWKLDEDRRVMLAGQNYFFRGIGAKDDAPPTVELSEKLWKIHQTGGVLTTGDE